MLQLGERMISLGLEGAASLSHPEREALKAVFTTIVNKMKVPFTTLKTFVNYFESFPAGKTGDVLV